MDKIKTIYCDFDGTITKEDAVNTFFEKYASPKWLEYEELWIAGKISSMENAIQQVALISPIKQEELDNYISNIKIDEFFIEFVEYIKEKNIKLVILSDGFDMFIKKTLDRIGLDDIEVYANHLMYDNGKFNIEFPYHNKKCDIGAGMCKCGQVKEEKFCYIGDGTSDLCIAKKAKYLFASKNLEKYCKENYIKHYAYHSFCDILKVFRQIYS